MLIRGIWAGIVITLPLIALADVWVMNYFDGANCRGDCGSGGLVGAYALQLVGLVFWVAGMCLFVVEVFRTRGRGWWAWAAFALEVACPLSLGLNPFA